MAFFKGGLFQGDPNLGNYPCARQGLCGGNWLQMNLPGDARVKGRGQKALGITWHLLCAGYLDILDTCPATSLLDQVLCFISEMEVETPRGELTCLRSQFCCQSYDLSSKANFLPRDAVLRRGEGVKEGEALW